MREQAWVTYIAPHQNPKKMKRSRKTFWPIKGDKSSSGPTDKMIEVMQKAQEQYQKDLKKSKDGRGKE